ncbi:leucine zipper putative tumor suppressor 2, partial [Striga asiatica]
VVTSESLSLPLTCRLLPAARSSKVPNSTEIAAPAHRSQVANLASSSLAPDGRCAVHRRRSLREQGLKLASTKPLNGVLRYQGLQSPSVITGKRFKVQPSYLEITLSPVELSAAARRSILEGLATSVPCNCRTRTPVSQVATLSSPALDGRCAVTVAEA